MVDLLVGWLGGWLVRRSLGQFGGSGWLVGQCVGWLAGLSVSWSFGRSDDRAVGLDKFICQRVEDAYELFMSILQSANSTSRNSNTC